MNVAKSDTPSKNTTQNVQQAIHNIGIIAHIDAGKTTLSERILFYTKKIHRLGEVHNGTATMDYLPEEQERGITITSACTSCVWQDATINLIDTPGHVDFTVEVERSLRVLDGAVGVFCAVGGVEPQSETVWNQSEQFAIPKVIFINKLDRAGADFTGTLDAIRTRLGAQPVVLNVPVGEAEMFTGLLDVVREEYLVFSDDDQGRTVLRTPLTEQTTLQTQLAPWREQLLETLAENDDTFMEAYLENTFTTEDIQTALRRVTLARTLTPVLCGSALRNIGVQPLLEAVCAFLPNASVLSDLQVSALETQETLVITRDPHAPFVGLVFKILLDNARVLALVRVYAGTLKEGDSVQNVTRGTTERIARMYRLHADRREQIPEAQAGDIVAVVGLRDVGTGDTLAVKGYNVLLEPIRAYQPVISVALEPSNATDAAKLDEALKRFCLEDPTLSTELDEGSGHRILSGMGELHLDVVLERVQREYRIKPRVGHPQVVKRETPTRETTAEATFDRELGNQKHHGHVRLLVQPTERGTGEHITFANGLETLSNTLRTAIVEGIENALQSGPQTGYPLQDLSVCVLDIIRLEGVSTPVGFHMAAGNATRQALEEAAIQTLEPLMFVEINVPEQAVGAAINLFATRNGKVDGMTERAGLKILHGVAPLSKLFGFSTALRSATQGRAGLLMRFERFDGIEG